METGRDGQQYPSRDPERNLEILADHFYRNPLIIQCFHITLTTSPPPPRWLPSRLVPLPFWGYALRIEMSIPSIRRLVTQESWIAPELEQLFLLGLPPYGTLKGPLCAGRQKSHRLFPEALPKRNSRSRKGM